MKHYDIFIIGAGAAGISAAKAAYRAGCRNIAIADRRSSMGGILLQCAHRGFGHDQNGPEYTRDLLKDFPDEITFFNNTTVLSVTDDRTAVISGPAFGMQKISYKQLILASGCREVPLGALSITGTRPSGIFTAGQMQELMNIHHQVPEGPVVILGSGDIGLVMADHLAEAGIEIAGIVEQKNACGGMLRNRNRLLPYNIPFIFDTTIREVFGYPELSGIILQNGTTIPCRTLLIAAGLVPEQELVRNLISDSGLPAWVHICGNARQVHPIVDGVVSDGERAGNISYKLFIFD